MATCFEVVFEEGKSQKPNTEKPPAHVEGSLVGACKGKLPTFLG